MANPIIDETFVRDIAAEAFAPYGDYRSILPRWLRMPGVKTYLSENEKSLTGYIMVAYFRDFQNLVGDILAIAVAPEFRGRGIGRALLRHAVSVCEKASEHYPVRAIRLSVADTNTRAFDLFKSCGFQELEGDFGYYEGGQKAIHMECPIRNPIHSPTRNH
jgi:ribosomal protein S18 acetylase RimI-like enzyme